MWHVPRRVFAVAVFALLAASASVAQQRGVRPPVPDEQRFDCPGVNELPEPACCRIALLIDADGKTAAARANCSSPSAEALAISCQLPRTYKPAKKFGDPVQYLTETRMIFKTSKPKQGMQLCEGLPEPKVTDPLD